MTAIRWWLFKRLSDIGWEICPEPHKSNLLARMPSWDELGYSNPASVPD